MTLIADPPFGKPSDRAATFSAGRTHFFAIRLQLRARTKLQSCRFFCFFLAFIASYCNEVELEEEVGGGGGGGGGWRGRAACTLGNIKTDSAPRALIRKTIKNEHKPVFNALPLSPPTCFSSVLDGAEVCSCSRGRGGPRGRRCQNEESARNTGMFARRCGRSMKTNWQAIYCSFV